MTARHEAWLRSRLPAARQSGPASVTWYGFELPIPPVLAIARVVLVAAAWSRLA
jgi:hypothetical protein